MYFKQESYKKQFLFFIIVSAFFSLDSFSQFGTTHFIVGCKSNKAFDKGVEVTSREKNSLKRERSSSKKQENIRGGAKLIDATRSTQCFFSTVHDVADIIFSLLSQAKKTLHIAAFHLTDKRIADLIVKKHEEKLKVCVIVDANNMKHAYSKVDKLVNNGVSVWAYSPQLNPFCPKKRFSEPLMHHKCIIIDDEVVITGSANLTQSGQNSNVENINILRDKKAVNEHMEEIKRLKEYCTQCKSFASE